MSVNKKACITCSQEFAGDEAVCPNDGMILTPLKRDQYVGTVLSGRYEMLEVIGGGGMGLVYKARHTMMNRIVAIKILHENLVKSAETIKRFQLEAQAASCLSLPNILQIYDFGISDEGQPFMVMDYLEGTSLSEVLEAEGRLPEMRSLGIFIQACAGLAHAHQKGVIHRDLKPSNIMLVNYADEQADFVKIVDFGIAKLLNQGDASTNLTRTGEVYGSPLYMSPEQCRGQELDARSDLYSFGCVMYKTLTGQPVFSGTEMIELLFKQVSEMPRHFGEIDPNIDVPAELEAIVFKCIAKHPKNRYQSMTELKEVLEAYKHKLEGVEGDAPPAMPNQGESASAVSSGTGKVPRVTGPLASAMAQRHSGPAQAVTSGDGAPPVAASSANSAQSSTSSSDRLSTQPHASPKTMPGPTLNPAHIPPDAVDAVSSIREAIRKESSGKFPAVPNDQFDEDGKPLQAEPNTAGSKSGSKAPAARATEPKSAEPKARAAESKAAEAPQPKEERARPKGAEEPPTQKSGPVMLREKEKPGAATETKPKPDWILMSIMHNPLILAAVAVTIMACGVCAFLMFRKSPGADQAAAQRDVQSLETLAELAVKAKDDAQAIEQYKKAQELLTSASLDGTPEMAKISGQLGQVYLNSGNHKSAEADHKGAEEDYKSAEAESSKSITLHEKLNDNPIAMANSLTIRGDVYIHQGLNSQAAIDLRKAMDLEQQQNQPNPSTKNLLDRLASQTSQSAQKQPATDGNKESVPAHETAPPAKDTANTPAETTVQVNTPSKPSSTQEQSVTQSKPSSTQEVATPSKPSTTQERVVTQTQPLHPARTVASQKRPAHTASSERQVRHRPAAVSASVPSQTPAAHHPSYSTGSTSQPVHRHAYSSYEQ